MTTVSITPYHFGLYFTAQAAQYAQAQAAQPIFKAAWELLSGNPPRSVPEYQWAGLRYCLAGNVEEGARAVALFDAALAQVEFSSFAKGVEQTLTLAQSFEMIRLHPEATAIVHARVQDWLMQALTFLRQEADENALLNVLALATAEMAVGIVCEDADLVWRSVEVVQRTVAEEIDPRGYIARVLNESGQNSVTRAVRAIEYLVMMAEMATHIGIPLWDYQVRGVSVMTATLYPIYYFYVTDKWQWEPVSPEQVQAVFRKYGGYLEVVNQRAKPRDLKPLLEDLRPICDSWLGGLPTLTHGVVPKRGLFR
jgi:hypothetical protein